MSTPEEIKAWLKRIGKDRAWLGEQCGIGKRSVDNWLSSQKNIPLAQMRFIERLIEETTAPPCAPSPAIPGLEFGGVQIVAFPCTAQETAEIERAAELSGMTPQEFARKAIADYAAEILDACEKGESKGNGPSIC